MPVPPPPGPHDDHDPDGSLPARRLGRVVAMGFVAFFLMVALGVVWVWQKSAREQRWRDRVNAAEPFTAPPPSAH